MGNSKFNEPEKKEGNNCPASWEAGPLIRMWTLVARAGEKCLLSRNLTSQLVGKHRNIYTILIDIS